MWWLNKPEDIVKGTSFFVNNNEQRHVNWQYASALKYKTINITTVDLKGYYYPVKKPVEKFEIRAIASGLFHVLTPTDIRIQLLDSKVRINWHISYYEK
ncbi:hypothetical protein BA1DRAFT_00860 [Photorhabdus aegyptia]|uniref:Uncharacterized protein n=1 Tax=Photorhabdus aegyptia TaxID=2805098 RepID=A0A022PLS5_9GAMM|nr:hypothetical protein BA1DRAFT_00860 [Photorhabdus aegyptia]